MTAGELAARFSHSWPTTTRHLGVLVDAGLVSVIREGRQRRYVLNRSRLANVFDLWLFAATAFSGLGFSGLIWSLFAAPRCRLVPVRVPGWASPVGLVRFGWLAFG